MKTDVHMITDSGDGNVHNAEHYTQGDGIYYFQELRCLAVFENGACKGTIYCDLGIPKLPPKEPPPPKEGEAILMRFDK